MTQAASETVDDEVQASEEQQLEGAEHEANGETPQAQGEANAGEATGAQDDEVIVTIGESPTPEEQEESRAPEWVRELRKQNREKDRRLRELEQQLVAARGTGQQPAQIVVGEEPTLEGSNYDEAAFKRDWTAWNQRKQEHAAQEAQKAAAAQKVQQEWQAKLENYGKAKASLKIPDFQEAEEAVTAACNVVQQGVILNGADNPALVVAALGKNPQKLKELAAITDPVKFAFAVAKLETQVKVTPKKTAPPPERKVQSTVAGATAVDNQLEKLREEARRTGDLSKVMAYKRQHAGRG